MSTFIPSIALFIADPVIREDVEQSLRKHYDSLLLLTDPAKVREFDQPVLIIVDRVKDAADLETTPQDENGPSVLVIVSGDDSETIAAAYDAGVDDHLVHPFTAEELIAKTEKHMEAFRQVQ